MVCLLILRVNGSSGKKYEQLVYFRVGTIEEQNILGNTDLKHDIDKFTHFFSNINQTRGC